MIYSLNEIFNRHVLIFQTITDASVRNISMRCLNLRQLCVSKCSELSDQTLIALANYNPLLSTLEVAGCHQFTDIGFQSLGKVSALCSASCECFNAIDFFRTANILSAWTWKNALKSLIIHSLIWPRDVQV